MLSYIKGDPFNVYHLMYIIQKYLELEKLTLKVRKFMIGIKNIAKGRIYKVSSKLLSLCGEIWVMRV